LDIKEHYRQLFLTHGDSAESAQYTSRDSQERRFAALLGIGDLRGRRVLDFGCGTGHLASYLAARGIEVSYTGVDLVEELLEAGRQKHPHQRFCQFVRIRGERFDYVLISGVFNNKQPDNRGFYRETVRTCFAMADVGMAFNMMSHYVDFYDPELFYEKPEEVFRFAKTELTPYVALRNDYEVKPGVIPFEFAVYLYKRAAL
jgi:SAM-dependent methyltransferase